MRIAFDEGLSRLLRPQERQLCTGFWFTEGPVWVAADNCLLFSDIPTSTTFRWRPGSDRAEIYRRPSWHGNGMTLDGQGNVLTCEHSGRRVTRAPYNGPAEAITGLHEGKRLNSPNDIVVHSSGTIFFTDPPYGFMPGRKGGPPEGDPTATRDLDFQGVYRLDPDGTLTLVVDDFVAPNGLAFSPDESVLYIDDTEEPTIRRFRVEADLSLSAGEVFVDMHGEFGRGAPDGMKVDTDGRIWCTGPGGVWVVEANGHRLGIFELDREHAANVAFGGPDFSTLYLTANSGVYSIDTNVRGIGPGSR